MEHPARNRIEESVGRPKIRFPLNAKNSMQSVQKRRALLRKRVLLEHLREDCTTIKTINGGFRDLLRIQSSLPLSINYATHRQEPIPQEASKPIQKDASNLCSPSQQRGNDKKPNHDPTPVSLVQDSIRRSHGDLESRQTEWHPPGSDRSSLRARPCSSVLHEVDGAKRVDDERVRKCASHVGELVQSHPSSESAILGSVSKAGRTERGAVVVEGKEEGKRMEEAEEEGGRHWRRRQKGERRARRRQDESSGVPFLGPDSSARRFGEPVVGEPSAHGTRSHLRPTDASLASVCTPTPP
ncbi:hypothetical protein KM043_006563 [Ampulex compressa]|nr:hypothetical protein KM043_006563 [Ampulex compressa]